MNYGKEPENAVGDGINDDTEAILNWWANPENNHLYLPEGDYLVKKRIFSNNGRSNVSITFHPNARIIPSFDFNQGVAVMRMDNVVKLTIDGFNYFGDADNASPPFTGNQTTHPLRLGKCSEVVLKNTRLQQVYGSIYIYQCNDVDIQDFKADDILGSALFMEKCSNVYINNLYAKGRGSEQGLYEMDEGENAGAVFASTNSLQLRNSKFFDFKNTAVKAENCNNVIFANNLADGIGKDGFKIQAVPNGSRAKNGKLLFNTVKNLKFYEPDGSAGLVISGVDGFEVIGNTFYGGNKTEGGTEYGINLDGQGSGYTNLNGIVSNNQIFEASDSGIAGRGGANIQVHDNKVVDYGRIRPAVGIVFEQYSNLLLKDNISSLSSFPSSGAYQNYRLYEVSNIDFRGNKGINGREFFEIQLLSGDYAVFKDNFFTSANIYMQSSGTRSVGVVKFEANIFKGVPGTPLNFDNSNLTIGEFNFNGNSHDGASPKFTVSGSGTITNLAHFKNIGGSTEVISVTPTNLITD